MKEYSECESIEEYENEVNDRIEYLRELILAEPQAPEGTLEELEALLNERYELVEQRRF